MSIHCSLVPGSLGLRRLWLALVLVFSGLALSARADTAPETFFLSNNSTFSDYGEYWTQNFSVSTTTGFVLRFASDYVADAVVIPAGSASAFQTGGAVRAYAIFQGTVGTRYVTLGPGSYCLGVRNRARASNQYDVELDYRQTLPADSSHYYRIYDLYLNRATFVAPNGGYLFQPFVIQAGFRYFMDGGNSGLDTYIIPASELSNFRGGGTFQYYTDYSGVGDTALPGNYEVNLSPGTYYLCFRNSSSIRKAAVYAMERWRVFNQPGGIDLSGAASWNTSGRYVNIAVGKVENTNDGGTSGSLRLRLWATGSAYSGGSLRGYVLGGRNLAPLAAGYYYSDLSGYVPYYPPPHGYFSTTITLEQYTASGWYISDYTTFSGTTHF